MANTVEEQPLDIAITQNIRVGDRLGIRMTGAGARFNLAEEIKKGEKLGFPTFDAIYTRAVNSRGVGVFEKFSPDGTVERVIGLSKRVTEMATEDIIEIPKFGKNQKWLVPPEIVVVPNFSSAPRWVVEALSVSDIDEDIKATMERKYAHDYNWLPEKK